MITDLQQGAAACLDPLEERFDLGECCAWYVDVLVSTVKEMCLLRFRMLSQLCVGMSNPVVQARVFFEMQVVNSRLSGRCGSVQG